MKRAKQLKIHGRVQGVWYRAWTVETASRLGLVGWVRNCSDGTVEAVVQGDSNALQQFIRLAHQGPTLADVVRIDQMDLALTTLERFEQRPTA